MINLSNLIKKPNSNNSDQLDQQGDNQQNATSNYSNSNPKNNNHSVQLNQHSPVNTQQNNQIKIPQNRPVKASITETSEQPPQNLNQSVNKTNQQVIKQPTKNSNNNLLQQTQKNNFQHSGLKQNQQPLTGDDPKMVQKDLNPNKNADNQASGQDLEALSKAVEEQANKALPDNQSNTGQSSHDIKAPAQEVNQNQEVHKNDSNAIQTTTNQGNELTKKDLKQNISNDQAPANGISQAKQDFDPQEKSLVSILETRKKITSKQAQEINDIIIQSDKTAEDIIKEKNYVSEEDFVRAKAELNNVPFVKISDTGISPEALNQLDESVARRYNMLPFAINKKDRLLLVAMEDPMNLSAVSFVEKKTGYNIRTHYALPSELNRLINSRYAQSISSDVTQALQQTDQITQEIQKKQNFRSLSGSVVREAPINRIVETILSFAIKSGTSDVHIEPQKSRTRVRYRIDGILREKLILPKSVHEAVVSRIKILSDLKIDEKRVPQDGRFEFASGEQAVDLRVSTLPTINGEKVVMRLLKKNAKVPSLPELGLDGLALKNVNEVIQIPHGIILVTGPTGSGKTTTLYSILNKINKPEVNIMTLENPVEYEMQGVSQVQVNKQAGLTFASGLRSFLRQDPDIMMVGEIRDQETASLAVEASLTGHLVFSTLHTNSAAAAPPRLLEMGIEPFLLASSVTLMMGQRVVRRINKNYKEEYKPEKSVIDNIKEVLGLHFDRWCERNNKKPDEITLFRPKEDKPQNQPDYKGRVGIFEVLKVTEEIENMILDRKPGGEIEKAALKNGMLLMKQDGYLKALDGITTIKEVLRVAQVS